MSLLIAIAAFYGGGLCEVAAVTVHWSGSNGDWSVSDNWGGIEPTSEMDAIIDNGGTAEVTQPGEVCHDLLLGDSGTGNAGSVEMSGGSLTAVYEYIGKSGTGVFTQTGGINTVSGSLHLGYDADDEGTYNLNGGTLMVRSITKGPGTAMFNFGGGTLHATESFATALPMTLTGNGGDATIDTGIHGLFFWGPYSGQGGLEKTGAGILVLAGNNTYTGGTNITAGTLALAGGDDRLAHSGDITVNGGLLDLGGNTQHTYGAVRFRGGTVQNGTIHKSGSDYDARYGIVNATLAGPSGLTMSGTGTLTLASANTYSGVTEVSSGTLRLSHALALPGGTQAEGGISNLLLSGGVVELATTDFLRGLGTGRDQVRFHSSKNSGFSASGGPRSVNLGGAAAVVVWGSDSFLDFGHVLTLSTSTSDGTLTFENPIHFGSNSSRGGVFQVDDGTAPVDAILSGRLRGAGLLSKRGNGTLLLMGESDYFGRTVVEEGTLRIGTAEAIPRNSSSLTVKNGATLDLNGFDYEVTMINAGSGTILLGGGSLTVNQVDPTVVTVTVAGEGSFTKAGAASLYLASENTYTGPTIISEGVLEIEHAGSLPGGIGTTGGKGNLVLDGGALGLYGSGLRFSRGLGTGPDQVQFTSSGGFVTWAGATVNLGGDSAPVAWGQGGFVPDGSKLVLCAGSATGTLDFQNPIDLGDQDRSVQVGLDGTTSAEVHAVLSGALSGNGGLTKTGPGALTLTGECSYSGGTTISAGTLQIGDGGTTGDLIGDVDNQTALIIDRSDAYVFSASVTGPGTVTIGAGRVDGAEPVLTTIAAANGYTGETTVMKSILRLTHPQALPGGIGSTGGLSNLKMRGDKYGNGGSIIELAAGDFFRGVGTGPDQIQFWNGGGFSAFGAPRVVNLGGESATVTWGEGGFIPNRAKFMLGSEYATDTIDFQNPIDLNGSQTVQVTDSFAKIDARLSGELSGGGLTKTGTGVLELAAANTYTDTTKVSEGVLRLDHEFALPGGTAATGGTSNLILAGGVIDLAAGDFFRSVGTDPDQVQFQRVSGGDSGGGFSASGGNRVVNLGGNSATFGLSNSYPLVFGSSIADSTVEFQNPIRLGSASWITSTIQVNDGTADVDARFTGSISSSGTLVKTGPGTLELTADSSYLGKTGIREGRLIVANTTGSATGFGDVRVEAEAVLSGSGIIAGPVTVAGTLAPGDGTGILTVDNQVTFEAGAMFDVELNGPVAGSEYDQLLTGGLLSLNGSLQTDFGEFAPTGNDILIVIDNTGLEAITGTFQYADDAYIGTFNGCDWHITYDADNGIVPSLDGGNDVAIYSIPEPSLLALSVIAIACLLTRTRGHRRKTS